MSKFDIANPWEGNPIDNKTKELFEIITGEIELVPLEPNFYETKIEKVKTFLDDYKILYGNDFVKEIIDRLKKELKDFADGYADVLEFLNNYQIED